MQLTIRADSVFPRALLPSTSWLPFVDSYRTLCRMPTPEMKTIFEEVQKLALAA